MLKGENGGKWREESDDYTWSAAAYLPLMLTWERMLCWY